MDTAFKRRWTFEFIGIDEEEAAIAGRSITIKENVNISWNALRKAINSVLEEAGIEEDRRLGPFFLSEADLASKGAFYGKLLVYLWDDVLRHRNRSILFASNNLSTIRSQGSNSNSVAAFLSAVFIDGFEDKYNQGL